MLLNYCSFVSWTSEVASGLIPSSTSCVSTSSSITVATLHTDAISSLRLPRSISRTPCAARPITLRLIDLGKRNDEIASVCTVATVIEEEIEAQVEEGIKPETISEVQETNEQ